MWFARKRLLKIRGLVRKTTLERRWRISMGNCGLSPPPAVTLVPITPVPPPNPSYAIPKLFWVRKDLFQSKSFTVEDCFPISRLGRFDPGPTKFQLSVTGLPPRSRSFAEVVKRGMENHDLSYRNRRPQPAKKTAPSNNGKAPMPAQANPAAQGAARPAGVVKQTTAAPTPNPTPTAPAPQPAPLV